MKPPEIVNEEQSKRIVWVIQTVFSLVLARSFLVYKDCVLHPLTDGHALTTYGLALVYGTVLWSWIDYSYSTIVSPYRLGRGVLEKCRFLVDLTIVIAYAFLLFTLEELLPNKDFPNRGPNANIQALFCGITFIFLMYLASGLLRIAQYGRHTSRVWLITLFALLNALVAAAYSFAPFSTDRLRNIACITLAIILMVAYRLVRSKVAKRRRWIAIDVDGVLANQIDGVLPTASKIANSPLSYDDITEWQLPIGETNIADIIVSAQEKRRYVLGMPVHPGAQKGVNKLIQKYRIAIATARSPKIDSWTKRWLNRNGLYFDLYTNSKEGNKQNIDVEPSILIDDYIGNIKNFLEDSDAKAILFSQPWNKDYDELKEHLANGRLRIVSTWDEVPAAVNQLLGV